MTAKQIANKIKKGGRHVFLLHGEMGAGKTYLVSKVMKLFNAKTSVSSPTFSIINQYAENIYHIDLYRIEDERHLDGLGLDEILMGNNVVFIEWPSRLSCEMLELAKPFTEVYVENPGN